MTTETVNIQRQSRFNLRNVTRHPSLIEYRRLAALVAIANLWVFGRGLADGA